MKWWGTDLALAFGQRFCFSLAKALLLWVMLSYWWLPEFGIGNYIAWLRAWY